VSVDSVVVAFVAQLKALLSSFIFFVICVSQSPMVELLFDEGKHGYFIFGWSIEHVWYVTIYSDLFENS
jgi:hypothetical protein